MKGTSIMNTHQQKLTKRALLWASCILSMPALLIAQPVADYGPTGEGRSKGDRRPPPEVVVEHLILTFDADGDGELSGDELSATVTDMINHRPPRPPKGKGQRPARPHPQTADELEAALLTDFDRDNNGAIAPEELYEALLAMGPPPRPDCSAE
jgi:hypothetical protein